MPGSSSATDGFAAALRLLPEVVWHGLERATREEQLAQWAGLAAAGAACAVRDGRPQLAVELLEQGRSVLWTQALNLRSDLTRLAERNAALAERLDNIRAALDSPVSVRTLFPLDVSGESATRWEHAQQDASQLRRHKATEWDDALAEVRVLDGFEHFLAAIPYTDLATAALDGPVVIVNTSQYGCHALVVSTTGNSPRVINLPNLSLDNALTHADKMRQALNDADDCVRSSPGHEGAVLDVLEWLWDVIAEPVLTALGHSTTPKTGDPWPKVWWCLTGPLTFLPIHAAGRRLCRCSGDPVGNASVLDRVISSYTPTLTALTRARQSVPSAPVRQLTIGMPMTPGLPLLPAVTDELEVLARHFPPGDANHQMSGPQATCADVLGAITTHSWVHLACHVSQKRADPPRSGFALWNSTMTIADLATQPTQCRDLAFLSACETATGSTRHLDEAIHLAAAMQFLGYRHVIATLWTIADSPAPQVADVIYTSLIRGGRPDADEAGLALHQAVRDLRQTHSADPLLWAPYIHLGS